MSRHPDPPPRRLAARLLVVAAFACLASGALAGGTLAAITLIANPDSYAVSHDRTLTVPAPGVLANDVVLLGSSTAVLDSGPSHGTLSLKDDGGFSYTPAAGYVGEDTFRYHAHDGLLNTLPTTVTITVTNAVPIANDDRYAATTGVTLTVPAPGVLANDTDADGDSLTAKLVDGGGNGSLDLAADGSFTFKSGDSFAGDRTFTYHVWDGAAWSAVATVTISVSDAPTPSPSPTQVPTPSRSPSPTLTPTPAPSGVPTPEATGREPSPSPGTGPGSAAPGSATPPVPRGNGGHAADDPNRLGVPEDEPFGGLDSLTFVGFTGFDWAVPTLALSVPGLLLILAVGAQAGAGLFSIPFVRRWLGSFGLRRRRHPDTPAR